MEDDLALGLCIIKVLCLIVIAMSVHKLAYSNEYFGEKGDGYGTANGVRYASETQPSMFDNAEAPVFYNLGSVEDINAELQAAAAAALPEAKAALAAQNARAAAAAPAVVPASAFGNRSFAAGFPSDFDLVHGAR